MEEQENAAKLLEEKKSDWESFVRKAKVKTGNHTTMVRFYNAIYNFMIMTVILIAGKL
jgi:putative alpha-1,2-mannosidase